MIPFIVSSNKQINSVLLEVVKEFWGGTEIVTSKKPSGRFLGSLQRLFYANYADEYILLL